MPSFYRLLLSSVLIGFIVIADNPIVNANDNPATLPASTGYSALKLFLEDEQYLTAIRHTKMIFTFSSISDSTGLLIDDIANTSEKALAELEALKTEPPRVNLVEFSDELIGKATFDSLRLSTGKDFLFEADNFEKNLLISQLKVLRVISHLALQLEEKENNGKRKVWLSKLAVRYEKYYQQVNDRMSVAAVKYKKLSANN